MAQGILAPTKEHRMTYQKWLHVWARPYSHMPARMRELAVAYTVMFQRFNRISLLNFSKDHIRELSTETEVQGGEVKPKVWYRDETTDLYDIFDPYFIGPALADEFRCDQYNNLIVKKLVNLGDVIWPEDEWIAISGQHRTRDNPLKVYYRSIGEAYYIPYVSTH